MLIFLLWYIDSHYTARECWCNGIFSLFSFFCGNNQDIFRFNLFCLYWVNYRQMSQCVYITLQVTDISWQSTWYSSRRSRVQSPSWVNDASYPVTQRHAISWTLIFSIEVKKEIQWKLNLWNMFYGHVFQDTPTPNFILFLSSNPKLQVINYQQNISFYQQNTCISP